MPSTEMSQPAPASDGRAGVRPVDEMFAEACRHFDKGNLAEAARLCHAVVDTRRDHGPGFQMLGALAYRQKRFGLSADFFRQAALLMPGDFKARSNLATALNALGCHGAAAAHLRNVLAAMPELAAAHYNLGNTLQRLHRFDGAAACYQRVLALDPEHVDAHWNLALVLLRMGRFGEGWPEYEWRWRRPGTPVEHRNAPAWDGGPLDGRTLLLVCEQGLGDTIQFARYLPLAAARGGPVILRCQPELRRLLSGFPGVARIITRDEPLPAFDVQSSLMSLPGLFGTSPDTIPNRVPYLPGPDGPGPVLPDGDARKAAPGGGLRVGVVWGSSPTDPSRSCPLDTLLALGRLPGVRLFSLQKGSHAADLGRTPDAGCIEDLSDRIHDMADTAAIVRQLDLVVTVDTSVAHLAGALGRPTWILLPHLADWRWLVDREDCPWYPTARLFRQTTPGDWGGVFARVLPALEQWVSSAGERS
ncbi:MAG TPA: tetratricopeptide repeat-containing glycosyltransferase family protein [Azospirillum sp.]|nr:tetratricopeptide repeat-containing glycosyltransferase family protein [Azospirillum sp.]